MRILRIIAPCLIAAGLVVACDANTPTEQPIDVGSRAFSASQEWIRDFMDPDNTVYVDCLEENVHFYGEAPFPYQWHRVASASGVFNYHLQIRPATPNLPDFYAETASGKLYIYKYGGPINESFHSGPNESGTFIDKETYVAENGDRLVGEFGYHYTINANGDLTVDRVTPAASTCINK